MGTHRKGEKASDTADDGEVVDDRVACVWFDDEPGAVGCEAFRMCRVARSGSPMSCGQSNVVTRSYPEPVKVCAGATSKVMRSVASVARVACLLDGFAVAVGAADGRSWVCLRRSVLNWHLQSTG